MLRILIIAIAISCVFSSFLYAQVEKGSKMVAFNLNAHYVQDKNTQGFKNYSYASSFAINPQWAYFVRKNSCVGVTTFYNYTKSYSDAYNISSLGSGMFDTTFNSFKRVVHSFGLGFFYRKYFFINNKFAVVSHLSTNASYGLLTNRYQTNDVTNKIYGYELRFNVGLTPTMIYFPSPQYGIEFSYGYIGYENTSEYFNKEQTSSGDHFRFNFGPSSLRLGFNYYFHKAPKTAIKK